MDLTTAAAVKAYLGTTSAGADGLIDDLITRFSKKIEGYCSRRFPNSIQSQRFNGTGSDRIVLPGSPIIAITSLTIDGQAASASDGKSTGYLIDSSGAGTTLYAVGQSFSRGVQNIALTWEAGYLGTETDLAAAIISPQGEDGTPTTDRGVSYANGVALVSAANTSPGHYTAGGNPFQYKFDASDVGKSVTMSFLQIPGPVVQACIEMVGLALAKRTNLGISSKVLSNETVVYADVAMTKSTIALLADYKSMVPG